MSSKRREGRGKPAVPATATAPAAPGSSRILKFAVPLAIIAICTILLLQTIDLSLIDLGRHLKNGEVLLHGSAAERQAVLHTNFYSYTERDFPFVNHHWLSGVVFYLWWRVFSFEGLTILYAALVSGALLLVYLTAVRLSRPLIAAPLAFLALPIVAWRAEVRPEGFTDLLVGAFCFLLFGYFQGTLRARWIYPLPLMMLLWVNLHIGFVFGFLLLCAFCLKALLDRDHDRLRTIFTVTALSVLTSVVNPSWIKGLLYPLNIFRNYGFVISENQSLVTQMSYPGSPWQYDLSVLLLLLGLASGLLIWRKGAKGLRPRLVEVLLLGTVSALALSAVRNLPVFCLVMIPIVALLLRDLIDGSGSFAHVHWPRTVTGIAAVTGLVCCGAQFQREAPTAGLGLKPGVNATAEFLDRNQVAGPIFNDFNNGGYLIFHRFHPGDPGQVFMDGRPEAYPAAFFDTYAKMKADDQIWHQEDAKYHFNAIVFALQRNADPDTERFLLTRVRDPEWAPVFADDFNLIYLRRTAENAPAIKAHEIPRSQFR